VYQDRDEPPPGEVLELLPEGDVSIQDRARIEFGKKLAALVGVKNLSIKSATSLPPCGWTDNAFANSYRYSPKENLLMVWYPLISLETHSLSYSLTLLLSYFLSYSLTHSL
jgi:hypothetical protein